MRRLLAITLGVALAGVGTVALATRNSSGTFSLPATNPVTAGSTITSTWANGTMSEIATALTDSLDRNGKGGMRAPIRTPDGTASAPAHSYTNESGMGWYRKAAGTHAMAIGSTDAISATTSAVSVYGGLTHTGPGDFTIQNTTAGGNVVITSATNTYIKRGGSVYWLPLTVGGLECTGTPEYTSVLGIVHLRGTITGAAGAATRTCTITSLPVGFRPGADLAVDTLIISTAGAIGNVVLDTSGGDASRPFNPYSISFLAEN